MKYNSTINYSAAVERLYFLRIQVRSSTTHHQFAILSACRVTATNKFDLPAVMFAQHFLCWTT